MADIDLTSDSGDLTINISRDGTNISASEKTMYDNTVTYVDALPTDPLDVLIQDDALTTVTTSNKIITESDIDVVTGGYPNLGAVANLNDATLGGRY